MKTVDKIVNAIKPVDQKVEVVSDPKPKKADILRIKAIQQEANKSTLLGTPYSGSVNLGYDTLGKNDEGLTAGVSQENTRALNQSNWDKMGNGLVKAAGTVATTVAESFTDLTIGAAEAIAKGDISKIYDNDATEQYDKLNEYLREQFPNYASDAEKDSSALGSMKYANFWFDKVPNGAAFMAGAYLSGLGTTSLLKGARGLFKGTAKLAQAGKIDEVAKLANTDDALNSIKAAAKATKIRNATDFIIPSIQGAVGESGIEAREGMKAFKEQMMAERGKNKLSEEEIDELAKSVGNTRFALNLAIVGGSNMFQFGNMFRGYGATKKALNTIIKNGDEYSASATGKLGKIAKVLETPLEEAGQEGAQYATDKGTNHYYRKFDKEARDTFGSMIDSVAYGLSKTLADKEGQESMLLGFLLGGIGIKGAIREMSDKDSATSKAVADLNRHLFSKSVKPQVDSMIRSISYQKEKDRAIAKGDAFNYKNAEYGQFYEYVNSRVQADRFDDVIDDLESLRDLQSKPEEFKKLFGIADDVEIKDVNTMVSDMISEAKDIKKRGEEIDAAFGGIDEAGKPLYPQIAVEQFKFISGNIKNLNKREKQIENELKSVTGPGIMDLISNEDAYKHEIDIAQLKKLRPDTYLEIAKNKVDAIRQADWLEPHEQEKAEKLVQDLYKIKARKTEFMDAYKNLTNREEAVKQVVKAEQKEVKEAQKIVKDQEKTELKSLYSKGDKVTRGDKKYTISEIIEDEDGDILAKVEETNGFIPVKDLTLTDEDRAANHARRQAEKDAVDNRLKLEKDLEKYMRDKPKQFVEDNRDAIRAGKLNITFLYKNKKGKTGKFSGKVVATKDGFKAVGRINNKGKELTFTDKAILEGRDNGTIGNIKTKNLLKDEAAIKNGGKNDKDKKAKEEDLAFDKEQYRRTSLFSTTTKTSEWTPKGELNSLGNRTKFNKSTGRPELNNNVDVIRYANFMSEVDPTTSYQVKFVIVDNGIIDGIDVFRADEREAETKLGDKLNFENSNIRAVLYRDGKPVYSTFDGKEVSKEEFDNLPENDKVKGGMVYTSINTYIGDKHRDVITARKIGNDEAMTNHINQFREFRNNVYTALKEGKEVLLNVTELSKGVAQREELVDGKRPIHPIVDRIVETEDEIDSLDMSIATKETVSVGKRVFAAKKGRLYVAHKNGAVELLPRKLNEQEADNLVTLFNLYFNRDNKTRDKLTMEEGTLASELSVMDYIKSTVYFAKEGGLYVEKGILYFDLDGVPSSIEVSKIEENRETLKRAFAQQNINIVSSRLNENRNYPYLTSVDKDGNITILPFASYKQFLLRRDNRDLPVGTDLIRDVKGEPQFHNASMYFDSATYVTKVPVNPIGDSKSKQAKRAKEVATGTAKIPVQEVITPQEGDEVLYTKVAKDATGKVLGTTVTKVVIKDGNVKFVSSERPDGDKRPIDKDALFNEVKGTLEKKSKFDKLDGKYVYSTKAPEGNITFDYSIEVVTPKIAITDNKAKKGKPKKAKETPKSKADKLVAELEAIEKQVETLGNKLTKAREALPTTPKDKKALVEKNIESLEGQLKALAVRAQQILNEGGGIYNDEREHIDEDGDSDAYAPEPTETRKEQVLKETRKEDALAGKPLETPASNTATRTRRVTSTTSTDTDLGLTKPKLDRLARLGQYEKENIEQAKAWFKERFPNIPFNIVQKLIDNRSFGQFYDGAVYLYNEAEVGTTYHEAWHVVTQMFLDKRGRKALYDEYRKRHNSKLSDVEIEEALAEDFRDFVLTGHTRYSMPVAKSFFEKVVDFFKKLFGLNRNEIYDIFKNIESGYYANTKPLNKGEVKLDRAFENKTEAFTQEVNKAVNTYFFNYLFGDSGFSVEKVFKPGGATAAYNHVHSKIEAAYNKVANGIFNEDGSIKPNVSDLQWDMLTEFEWILDNWDTVKYFHKNYVEQFGIVIKEEKLDKEDIERLEEDEREEMLNSQNGSKDSLGIVESVKFNTKNYMPNEIKLLLASLPNIDKDSRFVPSDILGLPTQADFGTTYSLLINNLTNLSLPEMYAKIKVLSASYPHLSVLLDRLRPIDSKGNAEQIRLRDKFFNAFYKANLTHSRTILEDGKIYNIDSNSNALEQVIKAKWRENLYNSKYIVVKDGVYTIDKDKVSKLLDPINFLEAIGIKFTSPSSVKNTKQFNEAVYYIREAITKSKDLDYTIFDDKRNSGRLNDLLRLEAQYSDLSAGESFINIEGETVYPFTLNNFITIIGDHINRAKNLDELFANAPHLNNIYSRNSLLLKKGGILFDAKGNRNNVPYTVGIMEGVKPATGEGTKTSDLTNGDKIVQDIANLLLDGRQAMIRASDKSQEHSITYPLVIPLSEAASMNTKTVRGIFWNYLQDEIAKVNSGLGTDVDVYKDRSLTLGIFEELLTEQQLIDAMDGTLTQKEFGEALFSPDGAIANYKKEVVDLWKKNGIIKSESDKKTWIGIPKEIRDKDVTFNQVVNAFVLNHLINNIEQTKTIIGSLDFYKDLFKRTSGIVGTKEFARVDEYKNAELADLVRQDGKKPDGYIKSVVFGISKQASPYYSTYNAYLKNMLLNEGKSEEEATKIANDITDGYKKYEESDGQGYVSLDEYREILMRTGQWTDAHDLTYNKIVNGEKLSLEDTFVFQPQKLQYFGPNADQYIGENANNANRLFIPTFYKYSVFPILPEMQVINGEKTVLGELADYMKANQVGMALYDSANKVGRIGNNEFYKTVNGAKVANFDNPVTQTIDYRYLGIQVQIAPKIKTENRDGTQQRKLIWANQFNNGEGKEITVNGAKVNTADLKKQYDAIYDELVNNKRAKLIEELGFVEENGQFKNVDATALVDLLVREFKGRNLPDNLIDSIDTVEVNGKIELRNPLEANLNRSKIENILFAIVDNRLNKLKRKGGAKIQAAVTGFETKPRVATDTILKYYEPTEDGIVPAEIMIALPEELYGYVEAIGGIDVFNKMIEDNRVDERLLTYYSYRIPTQDLDSIDVFKVKKFLSPAVGDLVVVPSEMVVKTGSDFDVDKLNIFTPHFKTTLSEAQIQDDKGRYYDTSVYNIEYVQEGTKGVTKEAILENKLMEIQIMVAMAPENFKYLINPIAVDSLKERVNKLRSLMGKSKEEPTPFNTLKYTTILSKGQDFWSGKEGVGIAALYRTAQTLFQQTGVTYRFNNDIGQNAIFYDTNINEDGKIPLGMEENRDGENIGYIISMFISAYVDIAKDPYVFDLNAGTNNANLYFKMILEGASLDWISSFMNQPIIRELNTRTAIAKSQFLRANFANERAIEQKILEEYKRKLSAEGAAPFNINSSEGFTASEDWGKEVEEYKALTTTEQLQKYIGTQEIINTSATGDKVKFYKAQIGILEDYIRYQAQAKQLSDVLKSISDDTRGAGKGFNAADDFLLLKQKVANENMLEGYDKLFNGFIGTFAKNGAEFATKLYDNLFFTRMGLNRTTLDIVKNMIRKGSFGDVSKALDKADTDFITYIMQYGDNPLVAYGDGSNLVADLFIGEDSVAKKLMQDIRTNEKLASNPLVKELFGVINPKKGDNDYIRSFSKRITTFESNVRTSAYYELYKDHPQFARDLARLAILQGGLAQSPISFFNLVPYNLFELLTEQQFNKFKSANVDSSKFIDRFFRNNWMDSDIVPVLYPNYMGEYDMRKVQDKPFVRLVDDIFGGSILKKQMEDGSWKTVKPLGDGFRLKEYWSDNSILPKNQEKLDLSDGKSVSIPVANENKELFSDRGGKDLQNKCE